MKKRKKRNSKIIIFYGYGQRLIAVIQRYNNSRSNDQILRFVSVSFVKKEQSSNEWFDGKKMHATEIIYLQIFSSNQSESTVKYRNRYTTCQRTWTVKFADDLLLPTHKSFFFSRKTKSVLLYLYMKTFVKTPGFLNLTKLLFLTGANLLRWPVENYLCSKG